MSDVVETVVIARRFRGPPDSANGGYACGVVARPLRAPARVRLLSPPPLDEPLARHVHDDQVVLLHGGQRIAEGAAAQPSNDVPPPVPYDVASAAAERYRWKTGHPFATCFVCGPERAHGDGLRIFPGRVPDRSIVAAPWSPDASVCDDDGRVHTEVVWASLDCPSWFGLLEFEPAIAGALLGQLTARVLRRPAAGEPCVVIGWSRGRDGRKLFGGAALYTAMGELLGSSDAVWIELKTDSLPAGTGITAAHVERAAAGVEKEREK